MRAVAAFLGLMLGGGAVLAQEAPGARAATPPELLKLAQEFRAWRRGDRGEVDYAARVADQRQALPGWRQRFETQKRDAWPASVKVDYLVLQSELPRSAWGRALGCPGRGPG